MCTYTTWAWHVEAGEPQAIETVSKPRSALSPEEQHPDLPCSICQEDQVEVALEGVEPFRICRAVANDVRDSLEFAQLAGFPIETVTGYRVGRTRGAIDAEGRRTEYSSHAYGVAVDINRQWNGLYDHCELITPGCQLRQGGVWSPDDPRSITQRTAIYQTMRGMGWEWGGELAGRQKDFMHFSPTGD